jgi:hypothetical protein
MDRGKWEIRGEVRKWTDVPLQKVSPKVSPTNYID